MSGEIRQRGRPRTFDRAAALQAAMRLFWRHGYEGTSIADLTGAMGVTPPTLYAAFGSKEALYREALAHYEVCEKKERIAPDELPFYTKLETYLRDSARTAADPRKPGGCMVATGSLRCAAENKPAEETASSFRARALDGLISGLKKAQRNGELPADTDIPSLARFYAAVVQGISVQAIDGASAKALDNMVSFAMQAWPGKRPRKQAEK